MGNTKNANHHIKVLSKYHDQAVHKLICCSVDYLMTRPKLGYKEEWEEAKADVLALERIIAEKKAALEGLVQEQLSKRDMYCVAWHLRSFIEDAKQEVIANFAKPCETCKYNTECDYDYYRRVERLVELTGVKISPARRSKN